MRQTPDEMREDLESVGIQWADKEHAAELLEQTLRNVIAKIEVDGLDHGLSKAASESYARASEITAQHIKAMTEARHAANLAKVRYKAALSAFDAWRTQESTKRAEMNLR